MKEESTKRKSNVSSLKDFATNKENPFIIQSIEKIQEHIVKKYKSATNTGEKAILKAIDDTTGEIKGYTSFIRQIEVDEDKFAKLYLSNFSAFFDLKPQGIKVFGYILNQLVKDKDEFLLFISECQEETGYKSATSVRLGLTNLLENKIIARGRNDKYYYINPMIVFNGSRVTFANTYVKKVKKAKLIDKNQTNIISQIEEFKNDKK